MAPRWSRQWAEVRTESEESREPPHTNWTWSVPARREPRAAVQGWLAVTALSPLTIPTTSPDRGLMTELKDSPGSSSSVVNVRIPHLGLGSGGGVDVVVVV